MKSFSVLCLIVFGVSSALSEIPKGWKLCKKDDPNRNDCLTDAINGAIMSLLNGNRKLGVLPLEPLEFGEVHTRGDPKGPVAIDILFKHFVLYNVKNLKILSVKYTGKQLNMTATVPGPLIARSPYVASGRILTLPLTGDGNSNFTFWDGDINLDLTFSDTPEKKNGKTYLVVERLLERSMPKRLEIHLGNLFNGDKALGEATNKVLNENWQMVWRELRTLFEDAISEAFKQISNRVFSKIPAEDLQLL